MKGRIHAGGLYEPSAASSTSTCEKCPPSSVRVAEILCKSRSRSTCRYSRLSREGRGKVQGRYREGTGKVPADTLGCPARPRPCGTYMRRVPAVMSQPRRDHKSTSPRSFKSTSPRDDLKPRSRGARRARHGAQLGWLAGARRRRARWAEAATPARVEREARCF